jgi:hypothetical protein
VGRKATDGLEPSREVVGCNEVRQVGSELVVVVVVETLNGRLFDGAIPLTGKRLLANAEKHSLDLAICPRVLHLCQPVLDLMFPADAVKDVFEGTRIAASICELDTVVSQHRVLPVRNGSDQLAQDLSGGHLTRILNEPDRRKLACLVNIYEQIELAFSGLHLFHVDM